MPGVCYYNVFITGTMKKCLSIASAYIYIQVSTIYCYAVIGLMLVIIEDVLVMHLASVYTTHYILLLLIKATTNLPDVNTLDYIYTYYNYYC